MPIGQPIIRRNGHDLTIATLGAALYPALEAAEILAKEHGIETEVIDLRSAVPLDYQMIIESVQKTGKLILANNGVERNNYMRHIASTLNEVAFDYLDGPIIALGARNWIMPGAGLDKYL
ncbi:MAG: dehydrogenase, partial [Mycoplasma sp.]|nr:dehydrogenase [Mycoplasma sp.]